MGNWLVERRLKQAGARLRHLRDELAVIDEQLAQLADEADDMSLRSLVAETPGAAYDYHHAQAHADAMSKHRSHVVESIAELERRQDLLQDRMVS